ncbi:Tub_2 domain-containing protein [Cephalotus follicularis]|uniref:Tub_2 domain-containing protein n=1 Tax=Cephalotus follicularis TaxID=3775 RepID=A0A1Q3BVR0_CEPFO|nr:Tub_2 domain-containing protein [Cephalotus follicularis]
MTKVYPNGTAAISSDATNRLINGNATTVLTVWKKSLLFNCNGYTVYDAKGNLVFRVDNYIKANKGEMLLMDATGKPLLTIRRKRLSLGDNWLVYEGETAVNPRYLVRKNVNILNTKSLAHVSRPATAGSSSAAAANNNKNVIMYEMEGSYAQRCCCVYDEKRRRVAEMKPKESVGGVTLGGDVLVLVIQPEMDAALAMAFLILLDQMFGSSKRLS